jgi:Tol biopolymer transport system component
MGSEQSRPTITFGTFIEVVSDEPLTFEDTTPDGIQLRQLMDTSNTGDQLILLGWTENNEVVVRPGTVNLLSAEVGTTPTPEPETQWAINPETEQVRSIPEWPPKPIWTDAQQQLAEQISKDLPRQPGRTDLPVAKWFPSPDGQYLALSVDNKLHIYSVADGISIATLPHENLEYDFGYIASGAFWSSDGSRLAYPVTTTDRVPYPGSSILEQVYQVHISGSDGSNLNRLVLPWFGGNPHVLGWSPDNQYLAITAQFEEKSTLHLYAVRLSDQTWVDLTPNVDFFAGARALFWSPNGKMIAYTNRANNAISVMTLKY